MSNGSALLEIYETGPLTVVGFGGRAIPDQVQFADFREQIAQLIQLHGTHTLAFDLTGVRLVPSGMLGVLASLRKLDIAVHLYNPSPDVVEVLEITRMNELFPVHYIDVRGA